jgi:hypothetical protein
LICFCIAESGAAKVAFPIVLVEEGLFGCALNEVLSHYGSSWHTQQRSFSLPFPFVLCCCVSCGLRLHFCIILFLLVLLCFITFLSKIPKKKGVTLHFDGKPLNLLVLLKEPLQAQQQFPVL